MKPYFETRLGELYCGDALEVLRKLPKESVDVVITSPPYWSKRDYGEEAVKEWSDGWIGQLGLEPTPQMFVEHLIETFKEVKRVLKPTGSLFVNIDDTWVGGGHGYGLGKDNDPKWSGRNNVPKNKWPKDVKQRSLTLVPELFAIKMVYEEGWVLREKIIWAKKVHIYKDITTIGNAMPESVKNRFTHTWEYIFHFTKKPSKYYFNLDAVRVPHKESSIIRDSLGYKTSPMKGRYQVPWEKRDGTSDQSFLHPLGANPGDVVQINLKPFKDAHFSVFPPGIPELLIKAACPPSVCSKCGKPYEPIKEEVELDNIDWKFYGADENGEYHGKAIKEYEKAGAENASEVKRRILQSMKKRKVTRGYKPSCNCNAKGVSGIVLDPFAGAGTTLVVAEKLGRRWIGVEISPEYCEIIKRRFENEVGDLVKNHRLERWLK